MLGTIRKTGSSFSLQRSVARGGNQKKIAGRREASTLAQFRRKAEKKNLLVKPDPNSPFFTYPRERLGLDYTLNAVLNAQHRLTPYGEAFRNLNSRHLLMLSKGSLDENKALVQESDPSSSLKEFYVSNPELNVKYTPSGKTPTLPDASFRKLGRMIADHIGGSENVFVLDAAVGSHRLGEVNVRVITNDANVNLFLKHIFPRQGHSTDIHEFPMQYTVYVAPDLKLSKSELESLAILEKSSSSSSASSSSSSNGSSFSISNLDRAITLIAGSNSNEAIKESIVAAISSRILQDPIPSLGLMNASLYQSSESESASVLVFDPSHQLNQLEIVPSEHNNNNATTSTTTKSSSNNNNNSKSNKKENSKSSSSSSSSPSSSQSPSSSLYTAKLHDGIVGLDGVFWNHYGMFRMFQGITHSNDKVPRHRADIVEHIRSSSSKLITQSLKDLPNEVQSPSSIVFLIRDQNSALPSLSKLSLAQASKFLTIGYTGKQASQAGGEISPSSFSPFFHPRAIVSQPGQIESLFQELASINGNDSCGFYVLNTLGKGGKEMSPQDIQSILSAASNGSLQKAKTSLDSTFKFHTLSSVNGVKAPLEASQNPSMASKLSSILSL